MSLWRRPAKRAYDMRAPCEVCELSLGVIEVRGGQNTVRCAQCGRVQYNAPKVESGDVARTVTTLRQGIKPSKQARILDRDHGRCVLCGHVDDLTVGHLLSVADGERLGATLSELYDDANLAAMCESCNAGLGRSSVSTRTYLVILRRILRRILQAEIRRVGPRR